MIARLFIFMIGLLLAACGGPKPLGGNPAISVVEGAALLAPDGSPAETADRSYEVGPRDRLLVDVIGIDALRQREIETDITGQISVPMAGRIDADGMTLGELEAAITKALRAAYLRNPQVSVNVVEVRSRIITVDGSVREPGPYPAVADSSLMRAVARAKGVTEFAKLDDVVVFRTVKGQRMVALYNLGAIRRGLYSDPPLFPDDVVVVGDSAARRLFQNIVQAGALVTAPLVAILQR